MKFSTHLSSAIALLLLTNLMSQAQQYNSFVFKATPGSNGLYTGCDGSMITIDSSPNSACPIYDWFLLYKNTRIDIVLTPQNSHGVCSWDGSIGAHVFTQGTWEGTFIIESNDPGGPWFRADYDWRTMHFTVSTTNGINGFYSVPSGVWVQIASFNFPEVSTGGAEKIGNLSATLTGNVRPNGQATSVHFRYGLDESYGNIASATSIDTSANNVVFSAPISGLEPNTVYHFQAVAESGGVSYYGTDSTVTTQPSVLTLADLSLYAYLDQPPNVSGPPGYDWDGGYNNFFTTPPPIGFNAAVYISHGDASQIVVAFRGTVPHPTFSGIANIMADFGFATGEPSTLLQEYCNAATLLVATVQELYPDANLTVTGHSLGGALAQLIGAASHVSAVGFNAPGGAQVFPRLQQSLNVGNWPEPREVNHNVNYRIYGDVVSRVPGVLGDFPDIITIATPYYFPYWKGQDFLNFSVFLDLILKDHSIQTVVDQLGVNAQQTPGRSEPDLSPIILGAIKAASIIDNGIGQLFYKFDFHTASGDWHLFSLDAGKGLNFTLLPTPGSPPITLIDCPVVDGVSAYSIRTQTTGNPWSSPRQIMPGERYACGSVTGIQFVPIDSRGNPTVVTNMLLGVYFASTGHFSGTLIQSTGKAVPAAPVNRSVPKDRPQHAVN